MKKVTLISVTDESGYQNGDRRTFHFLEEGEDKSITQLNLPSSCVTIANKYLDSLDWSRYGGDLENRRASFPKIEIIIYDGMVSVDMSKGVAYIGKEVFSIDSYRKEFQLFVAAEEEGKKSGLQDKNPYPKSLNGRSCYHGWDMGYKHAHFRLIKGRREEHFKMHFPYPEALANM